MLLNTGIKVRHIDGNCVTTLDVRCRSHFLYVNLGIFILFTRKNCIICDILKLRSKWNIFWHLTWFDNKVRELIAVKVLHTSLLNTTVVAFKLFPLGSYVPIPAPSPPFKTILELVFWNGLQSCRCITPDVINAIKMPSFQYFLYLREQKKVTGG